jgi:hypothetical protein
MRKKEVFANAHTRAVGQFRKKDGWIIVSLKHQARCCVLTMRNSSLMVCAIDMSHMCVPNFALVTPYTHTK